MESTSHIIWAVIFGSIGLGYFIYGKKQRALIPLFVGMTLCIFPYFIANIYLLVLMGVSLVALPYFVRI